MMLYSEKVASVDKGTHACGRGLDTPSRGVIVLDMRQHACVLCLAKQRARAPGGSSEFSRSMDGGWQGRRGRWADAHQRG